jgi:hypothetical protein
VFAVIKNIASPRMRAALKVSAGQSDAVDTWRLLTWAALACGRCASDH